MTDEEGAILGKCCCVVKTYVAELIEICRWGKVLCLLYIWIRCNFSTR